MQELNDFDKILANKLIAPCRTTLINGLPVFFVDKNEQNAWEKLDEYAFFEPRRALAIAYYLSKNRSALTDIDRLVCGTLETILRNSDPFTLKEVINTAEKDQDFLILVLCAWTGSDVDPVYLHLKSIAPEGFEF